MSLSPFWSRYRPTRTCREHEFEPLNATRPNLIIKALRVAEWLRNLELGAWSSIPDATAECLLVQRADANLYKTSFKGKLHMTPKTIRAAAVVAVAAVAG